MDERLTLFIALVAEFQEAIADSEPLDAQREIIECSRGLRRLNAPAAIAAAKELLSRRNRRPVARGS